MAAGSISLLMLGSTTGNKSLPKVGCPGGIKGRTGVQ